MSPAQTSGDTQVGGWLQENGDTVTAGQGQLEQVVEQFADGQKCPAGCNCPVWKTADLINGLQNCPRHLSSFQQRLEGR